MEWSNAVLLIGGVMVGWALNEFSFRMKSKREWAQWLNKLRVENYAEWTAGVEANLIRYAKQTKDSHTEYRVPLCGKRLLLIEQDPQARRLIQEVHESIPALQTDDYKELEMVAYGSPEWDWPPFRNKMNELLDYVRQRMS